MIDKSIYNGYSVCFNEWALDNSIKNELGLLQIISSLSAEKGYCFASNTYFAELFETTEETISRKISKLEKKGYISIIYHKQGCTIDKRELRLTKMSTYDYQKCQPTIDENVKENNISNINNISINNIEKKYIKEKFVPPTYKQVLEYAKSRGREDLAKKYYDYFTTGNWVDSKGNKVKNWKQKFITWDNSNPKKQATKIDNQREYSKEQLDTMFADMNDYDNLDL